MNRKYYISASQPASHTIQYYSSESRTILPQFPFFTHTHTPSLSPVCRQHACLPPPVASVKRYPMCLLLVGIQYIVQFHILHPSSMTYQWPYPFSHQRSKKNILAILFKVTTYQWREWTDSLPFDPSKLSTNSYLFINHHNPYLSGQDKLFAPFWF